MSEWQKIGSWDLHEDAKKIEFNGKLIPPWIKSKILPMINDMAKRYTPQDIYRIMQRTKTLPLLCVGTRVVRGNHFEYKIIFKEGDSSNYGDIWRRRLVNSSRNSIKHSRPSSKSALRRSRRH